MVEKVEQWELNVQISLFSVSQSSNCEVTLILLHADDRDLSKFRRETKYKAFSFSICNNNPL